MDDIRILIADAHKLMRDCLAQALVSSNKAFTIVGTAGSGRELIDMAAEVCPNVVILDTTIPEINGIDAAKEILTRTPEIKILAISRHLNREYILEILNSGVSGCLLKSCRLEDLSKAVEQVVNGQIFLCPYVASLVLETALKAEKEKTENCFSILSKREREVLQLISEGYTCPQIADKLYISRKTAQIHRSNLKKKLNLSCTAALTRFAVAEGITSIDFINAPPKQQG